MSKSKNLVLCTASTIALMTVATSSAWSQSQTQTLSIDAPTSFDDARTFEAVAGGPVWGLDFNPDCLGYYNQAPALDINLEEGGSLAVYVTGPQDTTLAIQLPDETFVCNDDAYGSTNSALSEQGLVGGSYRIWPGSFEPNSESNVTLGVGPAIPTQEELSALENDFAVAFDSGFEAPGAQGTDEVENGPDELGDAELEDVAAALRALVLTPSQPALVTGIMAGGPDELAALDANCVGFADITNALTITMATGDGTPMVLFGGDSEADLTMAVESPDGSIYCSDDYAGTNPMVRFAAAQPGSYTIHMGTYSEGPAGAVLGVGPSPEVWTDETPTDFIALYNDVIGDMDVEGIANDDDDTGDWEHVAKPLSILEPLNPNLLMTEAGYATLRATVGGAAALSGLDVACDGYVHQAPTTRISVHPDIDPTLELTVGARAVGDATMGMALADGSILCNDDSDDGTNPALSLTAAQADGALVWIGAYNEGTSFEATIFANARSGDIGALDGEIEPALGHLNLTRNFDATIEIPSADAAASISRLASTVQGCEGSVLSQRLMTFELGETSPLSISVEAGDPTGENLLVMGPDDIVVCGPGTGFNFRILPPGVYNVWASAGASALNMDSTGR